MSMSMSEAMLKVGLVNKDQVEQHEKHKRFLIVRKKELNDNVEYLNRELFKISERVNNNPDSETLLGLLDNRNKLTKLLNKSISELENLK